MLSCPRSRKTLHSYSVFPVHSDTFCPCCRVRGPERLYTLVIVFPAHTETLNSCCRFTDPERLYSLAVMFPVHSETLFILSCNMFTQRLQSVVPLIHSETSTLHPSCRVPQGYDPLSDSVVGSDQSLRELSGADHSNSVSYINSYIVLPLSLIVDGIFSHLETLQSWRSVCSSLKLCSTEADFTLLL